MSCRKSYKRCIDFFFIPLPSSHLPAGAKEEIRAARTSKGMSHLLSSPCDST